MTEDFSVDFTDTPFPQTSSVGPMPYRLNWRCEICLTRHQEAVKDKNILDLGSHDGRFSYACLKLGARHVCGVEGLDYMVKRANENLKNLGYTQKQYNFIQDDAFDYLAKAKPGEYDTILCLGLFDHTLRQIEFMREIKRLQPTYIILDMLIERGAFIDLSRWLKRITGIRFRHVSRPKQTMEKLTGVSIGKGVKPCLVYRVESHEIQGNTIDPIDIIARPTKSFVEMIFRSHGFSLKPLYWDKKEVSDRVTMKEWLNGNRAAYIARPIDAV